MTDLSHLDSIVDDADWITDVVLAAMSRTDDARLKQIVDALVRHAHAFFREVRLTDQEFEKGIEFVKAIGQATVDDHNEVVLCSDVLGFSTLVTLLNTIDKTDRTPGALLGPFYRGNSPEYRNGDCIVDDGSPGAPLFVRARVVDRANRPVANAMVDVWQASPVGLYENQDPEQPDMNLRGRFRTDADGYFRFRSVRPAGYPIPTHGPVGVLLDKQHRHPYRPAHIHFVVIAEGYETLVSQVFADDSEYLGSDVVFGVIRSLVGTFELHEDGHAPDADVSGPYYTLGYEFVLAEGTPTYPTPPIK
ncbi:protocatechuate 3,4-dioxygenase beta subunit [Paraburkholderia sp. GAS206C]|uniref:dioxygenase family protein n=1 Tax=unclassified Paraburkholderia TaxID=2615204 RepID=UPI003D1F02F1